MSSPSAWVSSPSALDSFVQSLVDVETGEKDHFNAKTGDTWSSLHTIPQQGVLRRDGIVEIGEIPQANAQRQDNSGDEKIEDLQPWSTQVVEKLGDTVENKKLPQVIQKSHLRNDKHIGKS
jgi:hypothetical protein